MHVPPELINLEVEKLSMFSNKYMINVDFYENPLVTKMAKHNFLHQYEDIYTQIDRTNEISVINIDKRQSIFCAHF
jgi:hypothetical protein